MALPPSKPVTPATPPTAPTTRPAQPPQSSHPGAVTVTHAPPLPVGQPTATDVQKPVMETGDAEQNAGKVAMDMWKKRQAAEQEAGEAAVKRAASLRPMSHLPRHELEHGPEQ